MNEPPPPHSPPNDSADQSAPVLLEWVDVDQRPWLVELHAERIVLRSRDDVIEIPKQAWAKDIYIASHGQGTVVRIDTFACSARFLLGADEAGPLVDHAVHLPAPTEEAPANEQPAEQTGPLLWPKVSPLAVWAVLLASLTFIPVLGLVFAAATLILLLKHRATVRRAVAWRHSRALCTVATVLLVAGLGVSALAIVTVSQPLSPSVTAPSLQPQPQGEGKNWGLIGGALIVILLSLTIHEAAHAITAWWLGDGLARSMGRVTLNPLAHIDPFGTILLPLMLVIFDGPVFGYARPVPVRVESLPRRRRAHILISLAGPGSNMLLAAVSLMLLLAAGCVVRLIAPGAVVANFSPGDLSAIGDLFRPVQAAGFALAPAFGAFTTVLKLSFLINTALAMFNLIPIPPLDGSWVLEHLFPRRLGRFYSAIRPYGFLIFIGAIYVGLFQYLILPILAVVFPAMLLLELFTGL